MDNNRTPNHAPAPPFKQKASIPLSIISFNQNMMLITFHILIILVIYKLIPDLPSWLIVICQVACWLGIGGGVLLCLGYAVAIAEKNVFIVEKYKEKNHDHHN